MRLRSAVVGTGGGGHGGRIRSRRPTLQRSSRFPAAAVHRGASRAVAGATDAPLCSRMLRTDAGKAADPPRERLERVHFLDDQRRNRRRSRRFGVFAITAVAIAGLPLCVVIAPLLLGGLLVIAHVVDLF